MITRVRGGGCCACSALPPTLILCPPPLLNAPFVPRLWLLGGLVRIAQSATSLTGWRGFIVMARAFALFAMCVLPLARAAFITFTIPNLNAFVNLKQEHVLCLTLNLFVNLMQPMPS